MKKILGLIISVLVLSFSLTACKGDDSYMVTFESNGGSTVASQTINAGGLVTEPADPTKDGYKFANWYSDSALTDEWNFASDTVNSNITLYAKWEEEYTGYMVTIVDDANKPVSNVIVQWCNSEKCFGGTSFTDANGVLKNANLVDDTYNVHLLRGVPEGYVYNPNVQTTPTNKQITIQLVKVNTLAGEGTVASPYTVTPGAYQIAVESMSSRAYYSFTPTEAGTYVFESHIMALQNMEPLQMIMATYTDGTFTEDVELIDGGGVGTNFKYEVEVAAADVNKTIYFVIQPSQDPKLNQHFPNEFYFDIVKK